MKGVRWIDQPVNYLMVDLSGKLSDDGRSIDGKVEFIRLHEFSRDAQGDRAAKHEGEVSQRKHTASFERKCQPACKPGSVRPPAETGGATAIHLERPLPDASRDRPG